MSTSSQAKPKFINPPNKLKAKMGTGGIDLKLLEKAQLFIADNPIDFEPYADEFLKNIQAGLKKLAKTRSEKDKDILAGQIMQIKANGGMFRYQLVSDIGNIALNFIDSLHEVNDDALNVLEAHEKTIQIIIANKLSGDGGMEGAALVRELEKACNRYFKKYG